MPDHMRKGFSAFYLTYIVLLALAGCLCSSAKCSAQHTPEEASFRIDVPSGRGVSSGSGTGISENLVLTNHHVGQRLDTQVVVWHALTKKRWRGVVVSVYPQADLALVYVAEGGLPWVKINPDGLRANERVYCYGYGSNAILRRGEGVVSRVTGMRVETTGEGVPVWDTGLDIEPGDSGSGIFNEAGELVGVNWGEDRAVQRNAATSATHVVELCNHFEQTQCAGGRCQTGGMFGGAGMGGGQMVPVRPPVASDPTASAPARPPVLSGSQPALDVDKLAEALAEKVANDPRFKGPKGDPGPPGKDGQDGRDAKVDEEQIVAEVLAKIDYDLIAHRASGLVNLPSPTLPASAQHVVIVADQSASYWPYLATNLQRAREVYHRIDVERPPQNLNFGELPALVHYDNGVPVRQLRGTFAVNQELINIARGEPTPVN